MEALINLATLLCVVIIIWRLFIMPTAQETHDAILALAGDLKAHVDSARDKVLSKLDALEAKIVELSGANPAIDFSDVSAALEDLKTEADAIGTSADNAPV